MREKATTAGTANRRRRAYHPAPASLLHGMRPLPSDRKSQSSSAIGLGYLPGELLPGPWVLPHRPDDDVLPAAASRGAPRRIASADEAIGLGYLPDELLPGPVAVPHWPPGR